MPRMVKAAVGKMHNNKLIQHQSRNLSFFDGILIKLRLLSVQRANVLIMCVLSSLRSPRCLDNLSLPVVSEEEPKLIGNIFS